MSLSLSIAKRNKRVLEQINSKYFSGLRAGEKTTYYLDPSFYKLYLERILCVLWNVITFKTSAFKTFGRILSKKYFPFYINQKTAEQNNRFKEFVRVLLGFRLLYLSELYDALPVSEILKRKLSLAASINPKVSIIIPVYNNLSFTFNCLRSIFENVSPAVSYEVIIVDDCSTDKTELFFKSNTSGIRYIRNDANAGFLHSCNTAAAQAGGEYICLLNNDTQIRKNWLESLLSIIENDPKAGCIGSKLIYPHGFLQEAGGIVFNDASGANYGHMGNPSDEKYIYIREVDYCSGASILFRKNDFLSLGGFDTRYAPAYYEDTDFCMSVRNVLNKKVIYQPFSELIHFEGITSGKEVKPGTVKYYQEINCVKFFEKWKTALQLHDKNEDVDYSARRLLKPAIAVIELLPTYDKDSGSLRITRIMRILKSLDFHVIFSPPTPDIREPYYSTLLGEGIEMSNELCSALRREEYPSATSMIRRLGYVWLSRPELNDTFQKKLSSFKHLKLIYDTLDLHHIRMKREAELYHNEELLKEAEKMKKLEIEVANTADVTLTVTEKEQQILKTYGIKSTSVVPNIHYPYPSKNLKSMNERSGLLFIGGYTHPPNIDGVKWLINEIMPMVWQKNPDINVFLLGNKPTQDVLDLASDKVIVPGFIEDVSEYFLSSRVFVSPLRYGAGMKGKIGQSMEYSLPVVSTNIGVEGMGLEHERDVLVADNEISFASEILRLYEDDILWNTLSKSSYEAVYKFSPPIVKEHLRMLLKSLNKTAETSQ